MEPSACTRVTAAMRSVSRADFLPPRQRRNTALDQPLHLTDGQTCSQPTTVRIMLELLAMEPGQRVLDVGSGSGWTTALLARLVGPTGRVDGVELRPELAEFGRSNLARAGLPQAQIHLAVDGVLGWPWLAPYDRILVSAEARAVPRALAEQLADGGRMVIPVRGRMTVVTMADGVPSAEQAPGTYRFVPLIEPEPGAGQVDGG
ncbi:protein-L-isoaspartate O-methyltransferase [Occultella glacieicola]|uniref:Protein-L-isoaspartate O-methyltransferase n=1 Tax=Occultella glacieicola TaxID=2518684 RepID=A0ABY2E5N3_9MICO|nr:protein-L-isoaspartate O-methyltransferase [Occultella glacieicola]TDE94806.1 protein-L-isoaspartate O-methyltransferase [Occultella glacieicola]